MGLPRPTMIANLAVTYRCNSKCGTCGIWKTNASPEEELTPGEISGLLNENSELLGGVRSIQLTGGEPFLRNDLAAIVDGIHEALPRCFIWVPTNGSLPEATRDLAEHAALHGIPLGVSVSLDGGEAIHDAQRGVTGSYRSALETLRYLSGAQRGIRVSVGFTLTEDNAGEVDHVISVARLHHADFSLRVAHQSDAYYRNEEQPQDPEAARKAIKLAAGASVADRGLLKSLTALAFYNGSEKSLTGKASRRCSAGSGSFYLDPTGNVYPCLFDSTCLGNIRESPFREIWGSTEAEEARRRIRGRGCAECWVECEAYRDLARDYPRLTASALRWLLAS